MPTGMLTTADVVPRRVGRTRVGIGRLGQRRVGRTRVAISGLGQPAAPSMLEQVRTIYDGVVKLDPIIGFAGDHPYLFISLLMATIGAGAAVGAFVGGGGVEALQDVLKKRRR